MHTRCSTICLTVTAMQFLLLRPPTTQTIPARFTLPSLLASSFTTKTQSESQLSHSTPDPTPGPEPKNSLAWRIERLSRDQSALAAFQGWMRDGLAVHRGHIFHTVNRFRRRKLYYRALEINSTDSWILGILLVMEWVMRERPYKVTELDYSYHLEFTGKCCGIAKAEKFFLTVPELYQNDLLYNNLVMACLDERRIRLAYAYMRKMRELLLPISPYVYNRLMLLHSAPSHRKSIPRILTQMKADGVEPHTSTFNILLNIRASEHDIDGLSKMYDEMQRANVEPNEITYCVLAKAYAMARLYAIAETYVEAIERSKTGNNFSTLDILITLYGFLNKEKELGRTWKSVQMLPHVTPKSYMLAIEAFGKIGLIGNAEEIWAKLKTSKDINRTDEFNSILSVYCRYGMIGKATGIYNEMVANTCKPNAITYRHLALGYLKAGMVEDAVKAIEMGERETLASNVWQLMAWLETTLMVVEMFGELGKLEHAKLIFEGLKKSKYSRHAFVYNALFKGYVDAKVYEPDLLKTMILEGASPDSESYALLKIIEDLKEKMIKKKRVNDTNFSTRWMMEILSNISCFRRKQCIWKSCPEMLRILIDQKYPVQRYWLYTATPIS